MTALELSNTRTHPVLWPQVAKKLVVETPPPTLVNAYLTEIAKGYGVLWSPPEEVAEDLIPSTDDDVDAPDGGVKVRGDRALCATLILKPPIGVYVAT